MKPFQPVNEAAILQLQVRPIRLLTHNGHRQPDSGFGAIPYFAI
jgi:hypothetical protein